MKLKNISQHETEHKLLGVDDKIRRALFQVGDGPASFLQLNDTPDSYSGQANKVVSVKADSSGLEFTVNVTTDELVKVSANDTTAGYLNGKLAVGAGLTATEAPDGGNEVLTLTIGNDQIKNTMIDWGTGAGQVSTTDIPEGTNLYLTNERIDDRVASLIQNGTGIIWTYDDGANTLTGNVSVSALTVSAAPTSQTGQGMIVAMTYGESITLGDLLYFKSDGKVYKADANGSSTYPVMGLALATASSGSNNVLLMGTYKDSTKWTGGSVLTVGGMCYLSTTAGATVQTQPAATDDVIQVVGIAIATDTIYFNPVLTYITHT